MRGAECGFKSTWCASAISEKNKMNTYVGKTHEKGLLFFFDTSPKVDTSFH